MKTTVDAKVLKGMAHLAGESDVRQYLNGLWILARPFDTLVASTDGHVGGYYRVGEEVHEKEFSVRLPTEVLAKLKSATGRVEICSGDGVTWVATNPDMALEVEWKHDISERFPDMARLILDVKDGRTAQFDIELLALFVKARKAFLGKKWRPAGVLIAHNGPSSGARVSLVDVPEFIGVVMSLSDPHNTLTAALRPFWLTGFFPPAEAGADLV